MFWDRGINNHVPPAIRRVNRTPVVKVISKEGGPKAVPTSGASWESPFKDGGTHNWLYDWFHYRLNNKQKLVDSFWRQSPRYHLRDPIRKWIIRDLDLLGTDLLAMWYNPKTGLVQEERGRIFPESFEGMVRLSRAEEYPNGDPREPGNIWCHQNVMIIPLKEPLKIRTISKGNALKYWLAKPMQRMMHDLIRKYPQMALTGEPLEKKHIEWLWSTTDEMIERISPFCPGLDLDFIFIASGDFKGATDGVDIRATKLAFEAILSMVDYPIGEESKELYKASLRDVLYEQLLHYPKDGPSTTQQTNGQLMGSNLSFPILCVINLIGYWLTLEDYTGLKFEPNRLPVLINGDDILFRTPKPRKDDPKSFYELWKKNIAILGFELSVGKNYIHDSVFTVNSECWVVSGAKETPAFKRIRHFDVGLLTNNNASIRLESRTLPLADRLEQVLEGAHNKERAWRRLKHYYRKELKEWMQVGRHTTFNVFSAVPLGGLGVKTHGVDPNFTAFQRRMANFMRKRNMNVKNLDDLKPCEVIALTTEKEGKGLSYEVPRVYRAVKWVSPGVLEEEAELQPTKDMRSLPVLSRKQPITHSSWVKKYTTRSLRLFRQALNDGVVSLDSDPTSFDFVLALDRKGGLSGSDLEISQIAPRAKEYPRDYFTLWDLQRAN
jgi:hypothetical protein